MSWKVLLMRKGFTILLRSWIFRDQLSGGGLTFQLRFTRHDSSKMKGWTESHGQIIWNESRVYITYWYSILCVLRDTFSDGFTRRIELWAWAVERNSCSKVRHCNATNDGQAIFTSLKTERSMILWLDAGHLKLRLDFMSKELLVNMVARICFSRRHASCCHFWTN